VDLPGFELEGGTTGAPLGEPPSAVLVGDLGGHWTFALLQEAFAHLMDGAELIALSRDRYWLRGDGLTLDAGPFVVGLEYASGRTAIVTGKPSAAFFLAAVEGLRTRSETRPDFTSMEVAMVGDDVWTDVQGAQHAGLQGWLVRTGKYREDALRESGITPDRILASVAELSSLL
jgi:HAD superfamily hydrolase (TIGR01450 family)